MPHQLAFHHGPDLETAIQAMAFAVFSTHRPSQRIIHGLLLLLSILGCSVSHSRQNRLQILKLELDRLKMRAGRFGIFSYHWVSVLQIKGTTEDLKEKPLLYIVLGNPNRFDQSVSAPNILTINAPIPIFSCLLS